MLRPFPASLRLVAAIALSWFPVLGRAQRAERIVLPSGGTIEVLGLRQWTIPMIQDSLAKYSPGDSLQSHACAAILRYKLHFADASATEIFSRGDAPPVVVVAVREPQDSALVRYRAVSRDTTLGRSDWAFANRALASRPDLFQDAAAQV